MKEEHKSAYDQVSQSLINQGNILTEIYFSNKEKKEKVSQSLINQGNILTTDLEASLTNAIKVAIPYKSGIYFYKIYLLHMTNMFLDCRNPL